VNVRFAFRMVRREGRATGRRLGLHMLAIAVGVGALVAINSFRRDLERSVREQARTILGSDLELRHNQPFPDSVRAVLDSAAAAGVPVSYATSFGSMALAPSSGRTRLVQVRAIAGAYPYYGGLTTQPPERWLSFRDGPRALVDPAVLIQLELAVGDVVRLGDVGFTVAGAVTDYPGQVSLQSAIGPRIYIPLDQLEATNLIRRGSRAFYEANLKIDDATALRRFLYRHTKLFERHQVSWDTVDETEDELTDAFDTLARFLGLVGLAALLLGGVGVASAIHVYVKSRLETVAVLRCLGARQSTVSAIYLLQAARLGVLGAALGVIFGLVVQALLPRVLAEFLPFDVVPRFHPGAVLEGFALGALVALLFALLPLLAVRNVPPLRAIRRDTDATPRRRDPWWFAAGLALAAAVGFVSVRQAPEPAIGVGFAATIAVTTLLLTLTGLGLMSATRRFFPSRAAYVVRQGVANLFRPRNQTLAVTLALGFGVFLIATLYVVQHTLLRQFRLDARPDRPNLVLFDIQRDQLAGVRALLADRRLPVLQQTPIVPARIHALNGRTVDEILNAAGAYRYERWALRREYRHTYRDTVVASEQVVEGTWFGARPRRTEGTDSVPEISIEQEIARDLNLTLGDRITWNVQGVLLETRITSIRTVNWARFEPNFFVVFQPGALEDAPQMSIVLTRGDDVTARALFQRDLVERFPNVAAIDLTLVQRTVDTVIGRVTLAIRFMALFSIVSGVIILIGALATSRQQRLREAILLTTLGARGRQVRAILLTEYAALGALGGLTGVLLAGASGWLAARFVFDVPFRPPIAALAAFWIGSATLSTVIGALTGRELARKPPLEVLRSLSE